MAQVRRPMLSMQNAQTSRMTTWATLVIDAARSALPSSS